MIKIIFDTRLLLLLCLVMVIGFVPSCKKDSTTTSDKVVLLSFGPTGAKHGEQLIFIGNNLNLVTGIELKGASIPASAFKEQTAERIVLIIPASTQKGFATLKTPQGDIVSKTEVNFLVPVTITSMTAKARPGENITLKGEFLSWVTQVTFASDLAETTFVSKTLNQLVVKVPANAKTGKLFISGGGTKPLVFETDSILIVTLPAITSLSPNPILHASNLTITGTDLDLTKEIIFTGVATPVTSFVSQSATQIVVKVPAGTQKGKIQLVAASKVAVTSAQDLDVILPSVVSLAPNPIDPLTNLTITGTNLNLVTSVSFTGITAPVTTFVSQSATSIVVKVPAGTLKGKITLGVINTTLTVISSQVLDIKGGLPPLAPLAYAMYTDGLQNGFQDWSWAARDFNSSAIVREGTKSIKATYGTGGYEGITFHNDNGPATGAYTKFEFSVFGEAGTGGKILNIINNGSNWGSPNQVTILQGEWATFTINLSAMGNPNPLKEIVLQSAGWSGVIHIDHVGLR
ncbi:MAG: IPT/TIG domain-containing protein [Ferruginibacter sp.]